MLALLAPAGARAELAPTWRVRVEAGSDLPVDMGARVQLEAPFRLQLSTSLGYLPGPYVDLINRVVIGAGGYDRQTGELIKATLKSSLVSRTHLGWRPWAAHGGYAAVGYGLLALGGGLSGEQLLASLTGRGPPVGEFAVTRTYSVSSTVHMLDAELGWSWEPWARWWVRAALGFAGTIAATTTISPNFTPRNRAAVNAFTSYSEQYLNDTYTSYVFTPVVTIGVGREL